MRVVITINVDYDEASIPPKEDLIAELDEDVHTAISDGLLTPSGIEIIDHWSLDIT
jgi:hypothetical protein